MPAVKGLSAISYASKSKSQEQIRDARYRGTSATGTMDDLHYPIPVSANPDSMWVMGSGGQKRRSLPENMPDRTHVHC